MDTLSVVARVVAMFAVGKLRFRGCCVWFEQKKGVR